MAFLPASAEEVRQRGWERPDVLLVSGDAYIDHPSFAAAILGRALEAAGFKVAILAQPPWRSAAPWRAFPRPRLCCAVSAGNMDSMINHFSAARRRRPSDAYSPGGRAGLRPDRASNVYAQRCREAFPGLAVVAGGVEASLRRIAHYDFWSDSVRPSVLVSSKADLLGFGMGERTLVAIARLLAAGEPIRAARGMRGVAYLLGRKEELPEHSWADHCGDGRTLELPSFEEVRGDGRAFALMTRRLHAETNPHNARRLVQRHGDRLVVVNPPAMALSSSELDALHELPFERRPHPRYREPIPAWEMIRDSVAILRGCFGGCTFCSITMHQGRAIQSRSRRSVLAELERLGADPSFKGTVSDLGGPTANMYRMRCSRPEVEKRCRRLSCVHPKVCKLLASDHGPLIGLMRRARDVPRVKRVHIASGVRMDLANESREYIEELARHHVGGHLKVAPEHVSEKVLAAMMKPTRESFEEFARHFAEASARAGKEQYLVPYFIAGHPGSGLDEMIELALYLQRHGYRPQQVQDFIPAPMDIATCMYHTGIDPRTMKPIEVARGDHARALQRALMQYFKPENYFLVREALLAAGREDLIGAGPGKLIPRRPPPGARARGGGRRR